VSRRTGRGVWVTQAPPGLALQPGRERGGWRILFLVSHGGAVRWYRRSLGPATARTVIAPALPPSIPRARSGASLLAPGSPAAWRPGAGNCGDWQRRRRSQTARRASRRRIAPSANRTGKEARLPANCGRRLVKRRSMGRADA
jgi:hypothetical protein